MNLDQLKESGSIIFEAVVGSQLYGLAAPTSDTDIKGVFCLPNADLLKLTSPGQISDERNDTTFYEVKRFLTLAQSSNPNILELLFVPEDKVISKTPVYDKILKYRDHFITKQIKQSLGGYAIAQIKKARGQNKKIVTPIDKKRKDLLDFSYILTPLGSVPIKEWLGRQRGTAMRQENYGAARVAHAHNMHYIFYNEEKYDYKGLVGSDSNELRLSSIPKEEILNYEVMYVNIEGYSTYCKDYKAYWEWVEKRNPVRYDLNKQHGKGYDGKNLMHCFRLLEMGIEIVETGIVNVVRPNREWLLKVRSGEFEYDDLVALAEEKLLGFDAAVDVCSLPTSIDNAMLDKILMDVRYG